jgi:hypothetical protein
MAELEFSTIHGAWEGVLTVFGGFMAYMLRKRDERIDDIEKGLGETEKNSARIELDAHKTFATKDSMRSMFQETQASIRESSGRMEKQIDETRREVAALDTKSTMHKLSS